MGSECKYLLTKFHVYFLGEEAFLNYYHVENILQNRLCFKTLKFLAGNDQ